MACASHAGSSTRSNSASVAEGHQEAPRCQQPPLQRLPCAAHPDQAQASIVQLADTLLSAGISPRYIRRSTHGMHAFVMQKADLHPDPRFTWRDVPDFRLWPSTTGWRLRDRAAIPAGHARGIRALCGRGASGRRPSAAGAQPAAGLQVRLFCWHVGRCGRPCFCFACSASSLLLSSLPAASRPVKFTWHR